MNLMKADPIDIRDVEPLIKKFNATNNYPIEKWILDLETEADIQGWTNLQLFIFEKWDGQSYL